MRRTTRRLCRPSTSPSPAGAGAAAGRPCVAPSYDPARCPRNTLAKIFDRRGRNSRPGLGERGPGPGPAQRVPPFRAPGSNRTGLEAGSTTSSVPRRRRAARGVTTSCVLHHPNALPVRAARRGTALSITYFEPQKQRPIHGRSITVVNTENSIDFIAGRQPVLSGRRSKSFRAT
jgi:hypothetical protein